MDNRNPGLPKAHHGRDDREGGDAPKLGSRGDILTVAYDVTHGDRNASYGDPVEAFQDTGAILTALCSNYDPTPAEMAVLTQIAVKLSRMKTSPLLEDHYVDLAAYAAILYELRVAQEARRAE